MDIKQLALLILKKSKFTVLFSSVLGVLNGAASLLIIRQINLAVGVSADQRSESILLFLGLILVSFLGYIGSRILVIRMGENITFNLRVGLCQQIMEKNQLEIEKLGSSRLLPILVDDVMAISHMIFHLPLIFIYVVVVLMGLFYLLLISPKVFMVLALSIVFGILSYKIPMNWAENILAQGRREKDELFEKFRALIFGNKELKMNRERRSTFFSDELISTVKKIKKLKILGDSIFAATEAWGSLFLFFSLGILIFFTNLEKSELTSSIIIILYLLSAISIVLNEIKFIAPSVVALKEFKASGFEISVEEPREKSSQSRHAGGTFREIELKNVVHQYFQENEDRPFKLGPINLKISAGEVVFIVGGNGCGKTTLLKLLVGLYWPEEGEMIWDENKLLEEKLDNYRQIFSAIFSDFFLFESILNSTDEEIISKFNYYLEKLELNRKVKLVDGKLSTINLSQGQRKRLALLSSYLEDRPVYIFDEWAADQDPVFKEVFYTDLIPELKRRGKTVIAITHDDQYFFVADRIIRMESGKICGLTTTKNLKTLGDVLLGKHLITHEQLSLALKEQRASTKDERLGEVLIRLGHVSKTHLENILKLNFGEVPSGQNLNR